MIKTPRPHQGEAIKAVIKEFKIANRAHMVMACGTGKTFTALRIAEALKAKSIVVLVPSLALINQFMKEWIENIVIKDFEMLAVCSDSSVAKGVEETSLLYEPIDFKVVADAFAIYRFLSESNNKTKIVFCTYQSAHLLSVASKRMPFELGIFDEAHKTAGYNKTSFAVALSDKNVKITNRLFMTATPRHGSARKDKNGEPIPLFSMDDPKIYGRLVYKLGFREAINLGLICDYKIIISAIDENKKTEHEFNADYELQEKAIALQKAIKDANINKVITFHSAVSQAELFAEILQKNKIHKNILHINSGSNMARRIETMQKFKKQPQAIITNARCLTEGVDVPTVDMVAFLNPKSSKIDIVQAIGRALRNAPGKTTGYIFLPLLVKDLNNIENEAAVSQFRTVWEVLSALNEQDSELADVVKNVARASGENITQYNTEKLNTDHDKILSFSSKEIKKLIHVKILDKMVSTWDKMEPKIEAFHEKYGINAYKEQEKKYPELCAYIKRLKAIKTILPPDRIEKLSKMGLWANSIDKWEQYFNLLCKFKKENPYKSFSRDQLPLSLYKWLGYQRNARKRGNLPIDKIMRLNDIGVVFFESPLAENDASFADRLQELVNFQKRNGTLHVPQRGGNPALGKWCCAIRESYKAGTLPIHRYNELTRIGFTFDYKETAWEKMYEKYIKYVENGSVKLGKELCAWVAYQKKSYANGSLSKDRAEKLFKLNFDFKRRATGNLPLIESKNFQEAKAYLAKHKSFAGVTKRTHSNLFKWIYRIKQRYIESTNQHGKKLTEQEVEALKEIGFDVASYHRIKTIGISANVRNAASG